MTDDTSEPAASAAELSGRLQDLHRALIRAEIGDDPDLANPYTQLFALINDPRFAWMGAISRLVTRIDEARHEKDAAAGALSAKLVVFADEAAALIGEPGAEPDPDFRLRHLIALQNEPEVGLATGRLRSLLRKSKAAS